MGSRSINLLLLLDYAAPYTGNFIPSIIKLEENLIKTGNNVFFAFPERAKNIDWVENFMSENRTVYFLSSSFFSKKIKYASLHEVKKIINVHKINIIHTHFIANNYSLLLLRRIFVRKVRIVGNFMNHFDPPINLYRMLKILTVRLTYDRIIGSSESVMEGLYKVGVSKNKLTCIYNSLDSDHLNSNHLVKIEKLPWQKVVLMFAWRFERKGVDIALDSIKEINTSKTNIILALAYACDHAIIKNKVLDYLGYIPDWIRFLGFKKDVASLYNAADVFLSSSREEGFTYSVLEASYCNPMIIVSKIGGHPQDIPHSIVFDLDNKNTLINALMDLISLRSEQAKIYSIKQKEYVIRHYNLINWVQEVNKVYHTTLN